MTPADDDFRQEPHDLAAEQSVLGGMMLSAGVIPDVLVRLRDSGMFYRAAHQIIYETIRDLFTAGDDVDAVTVRAALARAGQETKIGGGAYLHTLLAACPAPITAPRHAEIVADCALRRRIIETGTQISALGWVGDGSATELADRAQAAAWSLSADRPGAGLIHVSELASAALEEAEAIERARDSGAGDGAVLTGFADLDSLLGGLRDGQMVIVAARPAVGKSTLAVDFVRSAAIQQGQPTAIWSLEMPGTEVAMRLLAAEARVPLHLLRNGNLAEEDWERLARHLPSLTAAPLWVDDNPLVAPGEIRAAARRHQQRHGLRLGVVDYMQLMTAPRRAGRQPETRQQEVSEMSRQIKLIAKELRVPMVALSQLNRGPELRQDKRPMLSDLRESGSLEQDSDVVILIHREDAYERESPRAGEADLIVAKHRNGPTATVTVAFQGHYSRFVDMAPA